MTANGVNRRGTAWSLMLLVGMLVPATGFAQDDVIGIPVGATPPPVTIEDLEGRPVALSQWIGRKPVLVEFWATWCPVCEELLPRMEAAHRKYGDSVAFVVIAVAVNQSKNGIRRHLSRHPLPFTFLWDGTGAAVRAFQAPATSYVVALDAAGTVVYTGIGADQDIARALEKAIARR